MPDPRTTSPPTSRKRKAKTGKQGRKSKLRSSETTEANTTVLVAAAVSEQELPQGDGIEGRATEMGADSLKNAQAGSTSKSGAQLVPAEVAPRIPQLEGMPELEASSGIPGLEAVPALETSCLVTAPMQVAPVPTKEMVPQLDEVSQLCQVLQIVTDTDRQMEAEKQGSKGRSETMVKYPFMT